MDGYFNNINLFNLIWKRRNHIATIVAISILAAIIFSSPFFLPPRYKSFAILYPAILNPYATERESEQMIQWLESRDIADSIIKKFDLAKHYGIKSNDRHVISKTFREFQRNLSISITRFESVKIEITDQNPQLASDMVSAMIEFYNKKVNIAYRVKYKEILYLEGEKLANKKKQLDSLMSKVIDLRMNYGLIDYGIQSNEVTRGYLGTFHGSNLAKVNMNEITRLKSNIQSHGDSLLLLTNLLSSVTHSYSMYLISYENALQNVNKELNFASIVSNPVPADKKSYPIRWVIVLISAIGTLMLSVTVILIMERKEFSKKNN